MKVQFKHQKKIEGKFFAKGLHDVPAGFENHWYVKHLIKDGSVKIVEEPKAIEEKKPEQSPAASDAQDDEKAPSQPQQKKKAK